MSALLESIRKTEPGRYLTIEEARALVAAEPYMAARVAASRAAEAAEKAVVQATVEAVLKKYDFKSGRGGYGESKCYRDVTLVYRNVVFAMLCDDPEMLQNKLLFWLRTILQALSFPGGTDSIKMCYATLRKEAFKRIPPESAALIDPFFKITEEILPS